ncbi:hypothetical protein B0H13DRAFT_2388751 [Mycena leptocephala]|nr:hypothetical protein B0H13DRAFT_2388751 [Mycena leptocephala]
MSAHRQLKTSTFPNLQKLSLSAPYHEPEPTTDPVIILDAPLLREATVSNIAYLQVHLPLGQLTVLGITFMDIPQIIALLRCCPNLLDLSCRFIAVDEDELPLLELRSLRSLNIPNEYILPCLTLPCLERLQIVRIDGEIDAATDVLQSLVSRSSCTLQFFSVRGLTDGTAAELQHFLRAANTITHLKLSFTRFVPLQFQIQAVQGDDVLPRLTHLEIHDTGEGDGYRLLADVLLWRRTHAALEMCELFLGSDVSTAVVIAEVGALGEAGLRVRITTRERGSKGDVTLLDTHPA